MSQLHLHHNHYTVTRNLVQCRDKLCLFRGEKSRIHFTPETYTPKNYHRHRHERSQRQPVSTQDEEMIVLQFAVSFCVCVENGQFCTAITSITNQYANQVYDQSSHQFSLQGFDTVWHMEEHRVCKKSQKPKKPRERVNQASQLCTPPLINSTVYHGRHLGSLVPSICD